MAEEGIITSETSLRVSSTARWSRPACHPGARPRRPRLSPSSVGISTSTLAGRGPLSRFPSSCSTKVFKTRRRPGRAARLRPGSGTPRARTHTGSARRRPSPARPPHIAQRRPGQDEEDHQLRAGRGAATGPAPRRPARPGSRPESTAIASAPRSVRSSRWAISSARSGRPRSAQYSSSRLREYDWSALVSAIDARCRISTGNPRTIIMAR